MRPVSVSQTGVGNSPLIVHDYLAKPFNVGLAVIVSGVVNYTVQHTFDDIFAATYNPAVGNWFNHDNSILVGQIQSQNDNYNSPLRASRVVVNSGTGTATLTAIQGTLQ